MRKAVVRYPPKGNSQAEFPVAQAEQKVAEKSKQSGFQSQILLVFGIAFFKGVDPVVVLGLFLEIRQGGRSRSLRGPLASPQGQILQDTISHPYIVLGLILAVQGACFPDGALYVLKMKVVANGPGYSGVRGPLA